MPCSKIYYYVILAYSLKNIENICFKSFPQACLRLPRQASEACLRLPRQAVAMSREHAFLWQPMLWWLRQQETCLMPCSKIYYYVIIAHSLKNIENICFKSFPQACLSLPKQASEACLRLPRQALAMSPEHAFPLQPMLWWLRQQETCFMPCSKIYYYVIIAHSLKNIENICFKSFPQACLSLPKQASEACLRLPRQALAMSPEHAFP